MSIGFQDDDSDAPEEVRDGHASECEPSIAEQSATFVDLCAKLRELGAVEVRAGDFRARFPESRPAPLGVPVTTVPVGPRRAPPPGKPDASYALYEGETLTGEDVARRREHERIRELVNGGET